MERHFDEELKRLNQDLIRMSDLVKKAIQNSIESLNSMSRKQAEEVIRNDHEIDLIELEIDEKCIETIAKHQPMARDLRFITTGMKINAELERIADLAVNISERVLEIADQPVLLKLDKILTLSNIVQQMIYESVKSFGDKNIELAKKVMLSDQEADRLRNHIQDELLNNYICKDPATAKRGVSLLLVARYLERISDHTTNIAEDVIYMVQGKVVKHHFHDLD